MKLILFMFFVFQLNVYSQLTCSSNGAELIYINGVLTSKEKGTRNWFTVMENLKFSNKGAIEGFINSDLDNKIITGKFLHNPSYGLLNDTAEMFSQMYYAKYGTKSGNQYFYILNNLPDEVLKVAGKIMPNPAMKAMGLLGISKPVNFLTMQIFAEESMKNAFLNVFTSKPNLLEANESVVNEVATHLATLKLQKKKAIIIAHSQGNAVLSAAVKKFAFSNIENRQYLTNYFGFYQVGTPVPPLNQLLGFMPNQEQKDFNSEYVLSSDDWIIKNANVLSGILSRLLEIPLYQSQPNYTPHEESEITDPTLHGFSEIYTNPNYKFVQPNSNGKPIPASELSKEYLRTIASKLQSNCNQPKAVITYDGDPSEYETSFTKKYRFYANESLLYDDKPDSKGSFKIYKWKIFKKEVVDFDEGHTDLVLASKTLGRDITFTKEGPENFFDVTIENYQEFTVSLEVVREDGGSNYTEFRFWPKLMDAKYSSSRITYCYKMDKRGTPAFYMDVIISGNNHQGTTFYLYWETNDQPSDYFGINVTDTYLGLRNVWGVYGDNLTFRLTKRVNFVSQDMIELGSYPVPVCRP